MYYVEVLIGDAGYHGEGALTYGSIQPLSAGAVVMVPLRNKSVMGIVVKKVSEPDFVAKSVISSPGLPHVPTPSLKLIEWMRAYYPAPLGILTQLFLPKQLPKKTYDAAPSLQSGTLPELPPLTTDQQKTLEQISGPGSYLLHGETGTGKTRVYIELTKRSLNDGKSAIILTPEIGLTSQLASDFRHVFKDKVIVVHSQLTEATRQRIWAWMLGQTKPMIVIGPRSALFSPLASVGLIVVDEAHDNAYKQDQAPHYHASRVAAKLAELHGAMLVLGSATPLVTDYFMAEAKGRPILRMQQIASSSEHSAVDVRIVDLRDKAKFTRKPYLSDELLGAVDIALKRGEQSLLFLNRRGTARVVFCEQCGWMATCPRCDVPLVYHGDTHVMRCHTCDFKAPGLSSCPICHNASVVFKTIGTKALADDIQAVFPSARVKRYDTDNKKIERIEENFDAVRGGEVDILVGTQTLAKGLDLPRLGMVGVVIADTSLYFPDYSAQERTYQLLSQVLGRIGRGHRDSTAVIQTYTPESPLLKAILAKDWRTFYTGELAERERFLFPPYCHLLLLSCRRASNRSAETAATAFARQLSQSGLRITAEGPAPAFHGKVQNKYEWQIVVKSRTRTELLAIIPTLPSGWTYDIDPTDLL